MLEAFRAVSDVPTPLNEAAVTLPDALTLVGVIAPRVNVIAGVVPCVATEPEIPLAATTVTAVTALLQLLSPRRNVVAPAAPLIPNCAMGTVPELKLLAFNAVNEVPIPLNDAPVTGPETISEVPTTAVL